jgi:hypothetical protein
MFLFGLFQLDPSLNSFPFYTRISLLAVVAFFVLGTCLTVNHFSASLFFKVSTVILGISLLALVVFLPLFQLLSEYLNVFLLFLGIVLHLGLFSCFFSLLNKHRKD